MGLHVGIVSRSFQSVFNFPRPIYRVYQMESHLYDLPEALRLLSGVILPPSSHPCREEWEGEAPRFAGLLPRWVDSR